MDYTFRKLNANDIFPMTMILSKIGVDELSVVLKEEDLTEKKSTTLMLKVMQILFKNLGKCKEDIFLLLSDVSDLTKEEISTMPMGDFVKMVVAFFKKKEFGDFMEVVSELLNLDT